MAEDAMLKEAIDAVAQGQRSRARDLLTRLLKADGSNPTYWLWMSSVVDSHKEQIYCLRSVLRLDAENQAARRGLVLLGAMPPPTEATIQPLVRRKWQAPDEEALRPEGLHAIFLNPALRGMIFAGVGLIVIGLSLLGIFGLRAGPQGLFVGMRLTITPQPWPTRPTSTMLPTSTPRLTSPTPIFTGPTPLWMSLEATYTPTPLYVNTPHPISEAFRAGLRAFQKNDLEGMLKFMQQAAQVEPEAPDVFYYLGEAYRLSGEYVRAIDAYGQAILVEANFAPAYLGRARTHLARADQSNAEMDIDQAIQLDPSLVEAYLERANYRIEQGQYEAALEDLALVEQLNPASPLLYLYRARAYFALQDIESALEAAEIARDMDQTLLDAYLVLGRAYIGSGAAEKATEALRVYTRYVQDNPLAWTKLGQALYETGGKEEEAIQALTLALQLDEDQIEAYLYRGLVYLSLAQGQEAVNDLFQARGLEPDSFAVNLGLGRALLLAGRPGDAARQLASCLGLADSDSQLAEIYYWRALALEESGERLAAAKVWQALLGLPKTSAPSPWFDTAQKRLILLTPTPTYTPEVTSTPTSPDRSATATYTPPSISKTPTDPPAFGPGR